MSTSTEHQTKSESVEEKIPGLCVLHLFCNFDVIVNKKAIAQAISRAQQEGDQVITVSMLGHKSDLGVVVLSEAPVRLRQLQTELTRAGCIIASSYLSLTELSEYSGGLPEAMKMARLRPTLPPDGLTAFCFYPMSKRRLESDNWFRLEYEERMRLMMEHGVSGRTFRGRVLQLVSGSTGLDDYEWGVTLFGRSLDDLKDCVYQMRYDEASARYADFGTFFTGIVGSPQEVLDMIGPE